MEEDINDNQENEQHTEKLIETMMVFNSHFAEYIKQTDINLFKRAVDYAKTFTEQDVSGIVLNYKDEDDE